MAHLTPCSWANEDGCGILSLDTRELKFLLFEKLTQTASLDLQDWPLFGGLSSPIQHMTGLF